MGKNLFESHFSSSSETWITTTTTAGAISKTPDRNDCILRVWSMGTRFILVTQMCLFFLIKNVSSDEFSIT